jgi:hypothetical protein
MGKGSRTDSFLKEAFQMLMKRRAVAFLSLRGSLAGLNPGGRRLQECRYPN